MKDLSPHLTAYLPQMEDWSLTQFLDHLETEGYYIYQYPSSWGYQTKILRNLGGIVRREMSLGKLEGILWKTRDQALWEGVEYCFKDLDRDRAREEYRKTHTT